LIYAGRVRGISTGAAPIITTTRNKNDEESGCFH